MMYKDIKDPNPRAKTRALRRIWELKIFEGDPDAKKPKTRKETVIAWNSVDAIRKAGGRLSEEPKPIGFVSWPRNEEQHHVYLVDNPSDGPDEDTPIVPTLGSVDDEEDWDR